MSSHALEKSFTYDDCVHKPQSADSVVTIGSLKDTNFHKLGENIHESRSTTALSGDKKWYPLHQLTEKLPSSENEQEKISSQHDKRNNVLPDHSSYNSTSTCSQYVHESDLSGFCVCIRGKVYRCGLDYRTLVALIAIIGLAMGALWCWNHSHNIFSRTSAGQGQSSVAANYRISFSSTPQVSASAQIPLTQSSGVTTLPSAKSEVKNSPPSIIVSIVGAITHPGLYHMSTTARVHDVLIKAGPILPGGSVRGLNRAEFLEDGEQISIGTHYQESYIEHADGSGHKVNINTASTRALAKIPGISSALAYRIVAYRKIHGKFYQVSDLLQVSGIKMTKLSRIQEHLICQ